MIEIQQLIVKAKINSGDSEYQNILETVESIVNKHVKSMGVLKENEKKEIIEECTRAVMNKIEFNSRA